MAKEQKQKEQKSVNPYQNGKGNVAINIGIENAKILGIDISNTTRAEVRAKVVEIIKKECPKFELGVRSSPKSQLRNKIKELDSETVAKLNEIIESGNLDKLKEALNK